MVFGVGVSVVRRAWNLVGFGMGALPLTVVARALSVGLPLLALSKVRSLPRGTYAILVLGGVRGGISIALFTEEAQSGSKSQAFRDTRAERVPFAQEKERATDAPPRVIPEFCPHKETAT